MIHQYRNIVALMNVGTHTSILRRKRRGMYPKRFKMHFKKVILLIKLAAKIPRGCFLPLTANRFPQSAPSASVRGRLPRYHTVPNYPLISWRSRFIEGSRSAISARRIPLTAIRYPLQRSASASVSGRQLQALVVYLLNYRAKPGRSLTRYPRTN